MSFGHGCTPWLLWICLQECYGAWDFTESVLSSGLVTFTDDPEMQYDPLELSFRNNGYSEKMLCNKSGSICPSWSYCNHSTNSCECLTMMDAKFTCDGIWQPKILECSCATYHRHSLEIGFCIYNCMFGQKNSVTLDYYRSLPSNISMWTKDICGRFNREGMLCSKCANNMYPRAYSFDMSCMECPNGKSDWWQYVLAAFFPLTVFYFMILLLNINVHSSHLQGFALYCQLVSTPLFARNIFLFVEEKPLLIVLVKIFGALYGIWNLDFFRTFYPGICLETDMFTTLTLDIAVAVYPVLLMSFTYTLIHLYDRKIKVIVVLWKPFRMFFLLFRQHWDIRTSTVDAFATFLFLSNAKLLSVCFDLLVPVVIEKITISGEAVVRQLHWKVYYNATEPYFGDNHVPYAYLSFLVLFVFVVFPIIVLTLYPFRVFQKCLMILPLRLQISLHTFMDAFQGCYKDGTGPGSMDLRSFSVLPFVIRLCLFTTYALIPNGVGFAFSAMVLVLSAVAVITLDPFKPELYHFSKQLVMFILILASFVVSVMGGSLILTSIQVCTFSSVLFGLFVFVLGVSPLLYISVYIFIWLIQHRKFGFRIIKRIQALRFGYSLEVTL